MNDVENDIELLEGAKILSVTPRTDSYDGSVFHTLHVRLDAGVRVNDSREAYFEIWQDEEGNGPGYLSYLGTEKPS